MPIVNMGGGLSPQGMQMLQQMQQGQQRQSLPVQNTGNQQRLEMGAMRDAYAQQEQHYRRELDQLKIIQAEA